MTHPSRDIQTEITDQLIRHETVCIDLAKTLGSAYKNSCWEQLHKHFSDLAYRAIVNTGDPSHDDPINDDIVSLIDCHRAELVMFLHIHDFAKRNKK